MLRRVRVVVVAEDQQQEMFLRQVLRGRRLDPRDMTFLVCAKGGFAADAWVLRTHGEEARILLAVQHAQPRRGLITVIDADELTVERRHRQLDEAAGAEPARVSQARIAYVVPRRNIETWLIALAGRQADEVTDYKKRGAQPEDCRAQAKAFNEQCAQDRASLPAIAIACRELDRVCT